MKRWMWVTLLIVGLLAVAGGAVYGYYWYSGPVPRDVPIAESYDLSGFEAELEEFLRLYHDPEVPFDPVDLKGHFSIDAGGETDLYGTADIAYVLWITDQLEERTSAAGRAEWASVINRFQNPETGLFDRGNDSGESTMHATAFATAALALLGHSPATPHFWAEELFADREAIDAWLDGFGWNQIWSGSHEAGAIAAILDAPGGIDLPTDWEEVAIQALEDRIDPATGYWKNGVMDVVLRRPNTIDLGGAAHFWWLYDHMDLEIPYPALAIEGILRTQKPSGIWGTRLFNAPIPQGIDFDAMNGYLLAWRVLSQSEREEYLPRIEESVNRYARAVYMHLSPAGAMQDLYHSTHKLVGLMNAIAETNELSDALGIPRTFQTEREWRSALRAVAWQ